MLSTGDIVIITIPEHFGVKRRVAVVLSSAPFHTNSPQVLVGIITTEDPDDAQYLDSPLQDWESYGLPHPAIFRAVLSTIPRSFIGTVAGRVTERDWEGIQNSIKGMFATS